MPSPLTTLLLAIATGLWALPLTPAVGALHPALTERLVVMRGTKTMRSWLLPEQLERRWSLPFLTVEVARAVAVATPLRVQVDDVGRRDDAIGVTGRVDSLGRGLGGPVRE